MTPHDDQSAALLVGLAVPPPTKSRVPHDGLPVAPLVEGLAREGLPTVVHGKLLPQFLNIGGVFFHSRVSQFALVLYTGHQQRDCCGQVALPGAQRSI